MIKNFIIVVAVSIMASCGNNHNKSTASPFNSSQDSISKDGLLPERPDFSNTDSIEFIYFPDPQKPKEYKGIFVKNPVLLELLISNLSKEVANRSECIHNTKFFLFRKGEVYKTIYFSDSCQYLAFAVNSRQYFVSATSDTKKLVDSLITVVR